VIFLFWTLGSALTVLLPTLEKIFITPKSETATGSFHRKPTAREYYLLYGPFLSVILFLFGVGVSDKHGTWSIGLIIIGLASIAVYWRVRYVTGYRKFGDVVWGILFSLVSFSGQFLFIGAITEQAYPHMNAWGVAFMCVGVPLAVHGLIFTYVTDWKKALRVYVLILVVLSRWPGLGFLGGLTLRYMGVGGGIPVSIRVKNYGRTGTVSGVDEMTGCLVLMTGGDVLIRPTDRILDCTLHSQFMIEQSRSSIQTYSRVERYARADVLRVSKFP
jgi:hypothetical protein